LQEPAAQAQIQAQEKPQSAIRLHPHHNLHMCKFSKIMASSRNTTTILEQYVKQHEQKLLVSYQNIGPELNNRRKGLLKLLRDLSVLKSAKLVVNYLDKLIYLETGVSEIEVALFKVELELTHKITHIPATNDQPPSLEEQLTQDMITLLTSFAGKLHRARNGK
jgi:predicted site-specific integrase-resolvase